MDRRQALIGGATVAALVTGATGLAVATMGSRSDYDNAMSAMRALPGANADAHNLVRYATLAPNGHNAQPW